MASEKVQELEQKVAALNEEWVQLKKEINKLREQLRVASDRKNAIRSPFGEDGLINSAERQLRAAKWQNYVDSLPPVKWADKSSPAGLVKVTKKQIQVAMYLHIDNVRRIRKNSPELDQEWVKSLGETEGE